MSNFASQENQDNFVAYVAAAVVVTLVSIFVLTWNHSKAKSHGGPQIAFAKFGPLQVETQNFSIRASLAVQTVDVDPAWVDINRQALNVVFRTVLTDTDAKSIKGPHGLQVLQDVLKKTCNTTLNTNNVQSVLLTDFVLQVNDSP